MIIPITPIPKPRITHQGRFTPVAKRYYKFADDLKLFHLEKKLQPYGESIVFHVPMPKSWSKKKKAEYDGCPHCQRPDIDNYCKAFLDAIYSDDSHVWNITLSKKWSYTGAIEIL